MINTTNTSDLTRLGGLGSTINSNDNIQDKDKSVKDNIVKVKEDGYTKSSAHELRMAELKNQISNGEYNADLSMVSEKITGSILGKE